MPRPSHATFSKTIDSSTHPMSPRYGGPHGSTGSPHGNPSGTPRTGIGATTSARRGGTPLSSPRAFPPSPGTMRGGSARDPQVARGARVDLRAPSPQGVGGKTRKGIEADGDGSIGLEATGEDSGRIRVAVRVRPFSEKEKLAGKRCVISMAGSQTKILDPAFFDSEGGASSSEDRSMWERTFSFDHSFWSHSSSGYELGESGASFSSQADVHQALGEFLLHNACRGFNCSLFAYGQTGSGKTYTMLGDSSDLTSAAGEGTAGLIPRMCIELFQRVGLSGDGTGGGGFLDDTHGNGQASVQVSFCEIYNEQVRDLFGSGGSGHSLRVREHPTRGAFVEGLSARQVTCYQQVQGLLEDGMSARATAATAMNEVSSRSHAIFTICITVTFTKKLSNGTGGGVRPENGDAGDDVSSRTSKICLVDLAGSERANATGAKGDRLREASNINKSLSTLSDVIKALAKRGESGRASNGSSSSNESFIPYRNSMLTWLLKDSIGGNSKTVMLAAISPVADAYQETMSTLRYVERAKEIVNSIAVNDASANPLIGKLREEVRGLQELLETREAVIAKHKEKEALLTAALERARVDGDDEASQALAAADAAADSLHAALQTEKREGAESAAAAAEMAAEVNRRHRRDLDKEGEDHAAAFDELARRYEENLRKVSEEAEEVLADELARGKQYAMEEERRFRREWEDTAEVERVRVAEAQRSEMAALAEQHRKKTERILDEAADNATSAAASAEAAILGIREKHKVETAQVEAVAEAKRVDEVRVLREGFHRERETAEGETREAQIAADAERESKNREAIADAVAATKAETSKDLDDLRAQHDAAFIRLSEAHSVTVGAAVDEASERLRLEHEKSLAASAAAVEATHKVQMKEAQRLADERATTAVSAMVVLTTAHEERTSKLEEENAKALVRAKGDADTRHTADLAAAAEKSAALVAAAKEDSTKCLEALKAIQEEELRAVNESHRMEILRTADTETQRAEAKLAAAAVESREMVNNVNAESAAALATLKHEHREEIKSIREQTDRASLEDVAKHEEQILDVKDHSTKEMADVEARHQQELAEAEKGWRDEAERLMTVAEEHRTACIRETERRLAACLTTAKAEAVTALTSEKDRHREELRTEREKVQAEAEERRVADLATSAEALSCALDEARAENEAVLLAAKNKHREELGRYKQEHQVEVHRYTHVAKVEREKRDSDAADAAASQDARLRDEMKRIEREHRDEVDRAVKKAEQERVRELSALQDKLALSLAEAKKIADTSISNLEMEHEAKLAKLEKEHMAEVALAAEVAWDGRSADLAAAADESAKAKEEFEAEAASKLTVLEEKCQREVARVREEEEGKRRTISSAAEEKVSAERARMEATIKELKSVHEGELARLGEEHISNADAVAARAREQRDADLGAAETRYKASADSIWAQVAKDKAALVASHLLELRKVQAEGTGKVERASAEAAKQREAQDEEAKIALNELQVTHHRQLQAAATKRDEAVAAMGAAVEDSEKALEAREREYREELQKVRVEKDAERSRDIDKALAEAQSRFEENLSAAIRAEETKYVAALKVERDSHSEALNVAEEARVEAENDSKSRLVTLEGEHRIAFESLEEAHRAAVKDSEDNRRREVEEFDRRVDAAETATADALASADELATRAAILDEMLKASVGSKEQELAGHRSRVAQLQAFVARREASISSSDADEAADGDGDGNGGKQSSARRSVQQRVIDLRAMAAGAGVGLQVGSDDTGFAALSGAGLVEGLSLEKYAEELEVVLVRASVEAAVARQDHLEAELQYQGVTRQLVGLKLVHAQLRENLEDTQVRLEHKSQSAARRLLTSAARLAYEFAKPDRFSTGSGGSTRSGFSRTAPRAMSSQNSGNRSPLSRVRGGGSRRTKTPPQQRSSTGNADLGSTF